MKRTNRTMFDYLIKVKKDKKSSQISDETSTKLDSNCKTEIQVTLSPKTSNTIYILSFHSKHCMYGKQN